jgi:epoxyqueuosine reductase
VTAPAPAALAAELKAQAYGTGFDLAGIAALGPAETAGALDAWLAAGYHGEMEYMQRHANLRRDSTRPLPGMRWALVVGLNYGGTQPAGRVARYARGDDYHRVMWDRLDALGGWLTARTGGSSRAFVDSGPVLERDLARRAGLGWVGKNTMLINPRLGSHFFIGALFTDAALVGDAPFATDHCGRCTRCLAACPTQAFVAPRVLDARQCISYLTIELRGDIPEALRRAVGDHLYGCDDCQDACPWNGKFARDVALPAMAPHRTEAWPEPRDWLALDDDAYRARFRGTAMTRPKRAGLVRNAAVAIGNRADPADAPALRAALETETDAMARAHLTWALARCTA